MRLRGYSSYTRAFICYQSSKDGALPDKDQTALPSQLRAEPRSLNNFTTYHMQEIQMSAQQGSQTRSGILKGTIKLLLKPNKRLSFYVLPTEKLATICAERLYKFKLK